MKNKQILLLWLKLSFLTIILVSNIKAEDSYFRNSLLKDKDLKYENAVQVCSNLYAKYYKENYKDSIDLLINYWDSISLPKDVNTFRYRIGHYNNKYLYNEVLFRIKLLRDLENDKLSSYKIDSLGEDLLNAILQFKNRVQYQQKYAFAPQATHFYTNEYYGALLDYVESGQEFDKATQAYAKSLSSKYDSTDVRRLICEVYADMSEPLYKVMKKEQYKGTKLRDEYFDFIDYTKYNHTMYISLTLGQWMPMGTLNMFGNHPELGLRMGFIAHNYEIGFSMNFRFSDSKNAYTIHTNKGIETSKSFYGHFIGFDGKYIIAKYKPLELFLIGGIGGDMISFDKELLDEAGREDFDYRVLNFGMNIGMGFQWFVSNNNSIGAALVYNHADRSDNEYLRVTGNSISLRFSVSSYKFGIPEVFGHKLHE